MIKVYLAGPYNGPNVLQCLRNIKNGINAATRLFEKGLAPYCPWLDYHFALAETCQVPHEYYYNASIEWLKCCDAMLLIDNWQTSKGTAEEIKIAKELNIPIFESEEALMDWCNKL